MLISWIILFVFSFAYAIDTTQQLNKTIHTREVTYPCSYNPCRNGALCYSTGHGKDSETHCVCTSNFYGEKCEYVNAVCADLCSVCSENGELMIQRLDEAVIVRCKCKDGYGGGFCDKRINENPCFYNPCKNNGKCYSNANQYIWVCPSEYIGTNCETVRIS